MSKKLIAIVLLVVAIAAIVPYLNAPKGYFIWDDINLILMDYQIKSWNFLSSIFSRDFFGFSDNARKYGYYRPLVTISYMIDWRIHDKNPAGYHVTNIAIHLINCLLIFFILARLYRWRTLVPLVATCLFATSPIHTESVTWIAGRTDPLSSLFFFLSLLFYMVYADRLAVREGFSPPPNSDPGYADRRRLPLLAASLISYVFALLAKEMALSLPFVVVFYVVLFQSGFAWKRIRRFVSSIFFFGVVSGLYLLLRMYKISLSEQAMDPYDVVTTILSFVKTIFLYIWKMLVPVHLTAYMQNDLVEEVFTFDFLVPFALLVALLWVLVRAIRHNRMMAFAISFLLVSLLPLSNFIRISGPKDMGFMSAERFLYIPSFALYLLLAMLFGRFIERVGPFTTGRSTQGRRFQKGLALGLLAVVLVTFSAVSLQRNRDWMDNETFFKACIDSAPNAPILYMLLGNVYSIEQNWDKAEETLKMAIEYISPRDREEPTWIYSDLAGVYAKQGLFDKALETMKLASKTKFHNSAVEYNYGEIYRAMGNVEKAITYYQRSLMIYRDNLQALVKLGISYQQVGQYELSNKAYLSALNLLPNDAEILNNIGYNYSLLGESQKAVHFFEESLKRHPNFPRAHANIGMELIKMKKDPKRAVTHLQTALRLDGKLVEPRLALGGLIFQTEPEKAYTIFLDAYRMQPRNIKTLLYLGLYHRDVGDLPKARQWFEKALEIDPNHTGAQQLLSTLEKTPG